MSTAKDDKKKNHDKSDSPLKPDPETLHTTDPQEKMEGPVSSIVQHIKEEAEESDEEETTEKKK